jgi:hypothetical protein
MGRVARIMMNIKKSYVVIGVIVVLVLIGISLLINRAGTGILEVSAPKKTPGNAAVDVRIIRDGKEEQVLTLKPGQKEKIRVKNGTNSRRRPGRQPESSGHYKHTRLNNQARNAFRRAAGHPAAGVRCQVLPAIVGGIIFSYGCDGEGPVIRHESNKLAARSTPHYLTAHLSAISSRSRAVDRILCDRAALLDSSI